MASGSRCADVLEALQRTRRTISGLREELNSREVAAAAAAAAEPSQELRDSLVDMYSVCTAVNTELEQRLSSRSRSSSRSADRCRVDVATPTCGRVPARQTEMEPPGGAASGGQVTRTAERCHQDVARPVRGTEAPPAGHHDKKVPILLKELDTVRVDKHRLLDQLVLKETELQRREVEVQLQVEQQEARNWERPTALLEELLAAQRDREQAVMSRLLLANEERDKAVCRAQQLEQATRLEQLHEDEAHLSVRNKDVDELLCCIGAAQSAQELQDFGSALVRSLQLMRERRRDITGEEMETLMAERDTALARCKQLEQDLFQEREPFTTQKQQKLHRQRGEATQDRRLVEAEQQGSEPSQSKAASSAGRALPFGASPPPQSLEAELLRCQEAEREANERARRLERLVDVLRKKVGTGSLRAVI